MVLNSILNTIFGPLLRLPSLWTIIIMAFILASLITFVYKLMTDQKLMKSLKEEMKAFQKEMKEFKEEPQKVLEIQKRAMETNMKYMMHSLKPTLITFIPLILIFGWMHGHLAYEPIYPDTEFEVSMGFEEGTLGKANLIIPEYQEKSIDLISNSTQEIKDQIATWKLKGEKGDYNLEFEYKDQTYTKDLIITDKKGEYEDPVKNVNTNKVKEIKVHNNPIKPLNIFGWEIGWLGTYIIFSIIFSMTLRKVLKLH